ncbi:MAG: ATP-binding protein, partial [Bacteroidia bacterium]
MNSLNLFEKMMESHGGADVAAIISQETFTRDPELITKERSPVLDFPEQAIHSREATWEFSSLFETAPAGLVIVDENGTICLANHAASELLGINLKELKGKSFLSFIENCASECKLKNGTKFCLHESEKHQCEILINKKDGEAFDALLQIKSFRNEKTGPSYFYISVTNIHQLKIHEHVVEKSLIKEKNLNEMKSRFISLATHEFRTPMASILSSAWLLEKYKDKEDDEKKLLHISKIKKSVTDLNDILNDFISLNQFENAIGRNNPILLDLVSFIKQLLVDYRNESAIHNFIFNHGEDKPEIVADRNLLKICLNNIIGNAVKYSPPGQNIEITALPDTRNKIVVISVKDEGIGIPEKDKKHVFEQFYRAKNADFIQGTGLGLYITKKM